MTVLLFAVTMAGVVGLRGRGRGAARRRGDRDARRTETGETAPGTTTEAGGGAEGDAAAGEAVFASAGCGGCHTLEAAGASGAVGPNLDESKPDAALVVDRVTNGAGAMPPFGDQLSEQQIKDVAAYVVASTQG